MSLPDEISYAQWRGCSSKRRFPTREAAQQIVQQSRRQGGASLKVYRCKFCSNFHLTQDHGDA